MSSSDSRFTNRQRTVSTEILRNVEKLGVSILQIMLLIVILRRCIHIIEIYITYGPSLSAIPKMTYYDTQNTITIVQRNYILIFVNTKHYTFYHFKLVAISIAHTATYMSSFYYLEVIIAAIRPHNSPTLPYMKQNTYNVAKR